MPLVEEEILINAPRDLVFDVSQDYAIRRQWDPFSRGTYLLDGVTAAAVGVKGFVQARNGFRMTFEYVSYQRPERAAIVMLYGPLFFKKFAGTWIFEEVGERSVRARFRYTFATRPAALRRPLDCLVQRLFRRAIIDRLLALKEFCESRSSQPRL
ncbi:MAG TPA: SRPBCC family protein [Burkholderiales bacterium]